MGDQNFMGGLMQGLGQTLQQQQELRQKQEYQKSLIDINKLHGKLFEAQAKAAELKTQGLPASVMEALNRTEQEAGAVAQAATAPMGQPQAGAVPQPQAGVPQQMAGNMFAGGPSGPVQIPGNPANNISVRQNNPFNLKDVGQEGSQGAGTRGFAIFQTPEAGVQAGIRQIQLDQSRGLPFAQFAEKYAPAYENPGWAADVAKLAGITDPNTPINQIPTMQLAQAVATRESQTKLPGGQQQLQPQQYQPMQPPGPQGQQLITPNFPKPTGISKMPLGDRLALDVYFKQTYDLDTKFRETKGKFKAHGDMLKGFTITNEDTGQSVFFPPTMQQYGRLPVTTQTGEEGVIMAPDKTYGPVGGAGQAPAGGGGAGMIPTKPGPQDMVTPVPENIRVDLQKSQDSLRGLQTMKDMVGNVSNDAFGFWAATKHKVYQNEEDPVKAIARSGYELFGKAPTPEQTTFRVELEKFNSQVRYLLYAGNLTPQEAERYQKQALSASTREQYLAVLDGMETAIRAKMQDRIIEGAGTQGQNLQRRATQTLGPPPALTPQSTRGMKVPPKLGKNADPLGLR